MLAGLVGYATFDSAASTQYCPQQELLPLVLQLLAALLLEPCATRPAVGDLDPTLAVGTALALLQVSWVMALVVLLAGGGCVGLWRGGVGWQPW